MSHAFDALFHRFPTIRRGYHLQRRHQANHVRIFIEFLLRRGLVIGWYLSFTRVLGKAISRGMRRQCVIWIKGLPGRGPVLRTLRAYGEGNCASFSRCVPRWKFRASAQFGLNGRAHVPNLPRNRQGQDKMSAIGASKLITQRQRVTL